MKSRRCEKCGKDISYRPAHHYLCYECWHQSNNYSSISKEADSPNVMVFDPDSDTYVKHNQTYEERYKGDSEYDMGPNWDYDEYPPENL